MPSRLSDVLRLGQEIAMPESETDCLLGSLRIEVPSSMLWPTKQARHQPSKASLWQPRAARHLLIILDRPLEVGFKNSYLVERQIMGCSETVLCQGSTSLILVQSLTVAPPLSG